MGVKREKVSKSNPLSYSSMSEFKGCERRYFYRKVARYPTDEDYNDNQIHFAVGKAFHGVQEDTLHEYANLTSEAKMKVLRKNCKQYEVKDVDNISVVGALAEIYSRYHLASKSKIIGCEPKIQTDNFLGFVDAVAQNDQGWFIIDLKTSGQRVENQAPLMAQNVQLNLYAFYRDKLAEMYNLKNSDFLGVSYRNTLKPKIKRKPQELSTDYIDRLVDSGKIFTTDFFVPIKNLDPTAHMLSLVNTHTQIQEKLKYGEGRFHRNFGNCMSYFKPCQFFSRCHGKTYSELMKEFVVYDSFGLKPALGYLPPEDDEVHLSAMFNAQDSSDSETLEVTFDDDDEEVTFF